MSRGRSPLWITVGLIALGVLLTVNSSSCGSEDAEEGERSAAEVIEDKAGSPYDPGGGLATPPHRGALRPRHRSEKVRGVHQPARAGDTELGQSVEASVRPEDSVYVTGIEDGAIALGILEIPMRDQYVILWTGSGHIRRGPGDTFLLDPCSARIEGWEAMDRLHPPAEG